MKKIYQLLLASCMGASLYAQTVQEIQPKLSPLTKLLLKDLEKTKGTDNGLPEGYIFRQYKGKPYLSGMVEVSNAAAVQSQMDALGVIQSLTEII